MTDPAPTLIARSGLAHRSTKNPNVPNQWHGNTACGRFARDMKPGPSIVDVAVEKRCLNCWRGTQWGRPDNMRVAGHGLVGEGAAHDAAGKRTRDTSGHALCSCGVLSDEPFDTAAARKRWHREHKTQVKESAA